MATIQGEVSGSLSMDGVQVVGDEPRTAQGTGGEITGVGNMGNNTAVPTPQVRAIPISIDGDPINQTGGNIYGDRGGTDVT